MNEAIETEYIDEEDPQVRGPWKIENLGSADWALRRAAECEAEEEAIGEQLKAAYEALDKRASLLIGKAQRGAAFFKAKLLEYAVTHRNELLTGTKKSRSFIHGVVGFRQQGGKLKVVDAKTLGVWLMAQAVEGGLYRIKIEPEMRALQQLFKSTGEIPPGCDAEPETEEPYCKPSLPGTAIVKGED